ncbi:hypothetical protein [Ponticaulis profundi]|uniref:Uncharacterized protein n=1 Tax=Ponticaulis profundi TaxID=2665222 RepID=A0ABW1SA81_9PROT
MKNWILAIALSAFAAPVAAAYDYVAGYESWSVYKDTIDGEPVCYAVTRATDKAPKSAEHGDVVFFVSYFRSSSMPQASLRVAYDLREDLKATAAVGGSSWSLYSVRNEAFANTDDETAIANALRRGSELKIEAMSQRNTNVAYHFSLSGSSNAIDKAKSLCS